MIPNGVAAWTFGGVLLSLVAYLIAARQGARREIKHPNDYFLARQRLTGDDLGDTQIAYALQMSTVYPFFILAASGAWLVPVLNSVAWFLGIAFFLASVRRFRPFLGQTRTIHALISEANASPFLRPLASLMTIVAFAGVIVFEIVYGASVFRVIFGDNNIIYYVIVASLTAYLVTYIWNGGQTATLRTEQVQLLVAYLGLHLALAHMFASGEVDPSHVTPSIVVLVVAVACAAMLWSRGRALVTAIRTKRPVMSGAYCVMLLSLLTLMVALGFALPRVNFHNLVTADVSVASASILDHWLMISTAILLAIFWQFVDLTNWQRICSLAASDDEGFVQGAIRGFVGYLIESPLSWFMAVLLGLTAPQVLTFADRNADQFEQFIRHFLLEPGIAQAVGVVLVAGIVGVFMSTADSAITAIGYAYAYDFSRRGRALIDKTDLTDDDVVSVVRIGQRFMALATGVVIVLFILLDVFFEAGKGFVGLLFAFYTPVVSLAPAVLGPLLFRRRPGKILGAGAIIAGAASGLVFGVLSATKWPALQWWPAPAAVVISWSVYLFGAFCFGERISLEKVGGAMQ
jgi:hypothetical protein